MNFEGTRTIETAISWDNIKGEFESMLRRFKLIDDNEDMVDLKIDNFECLKVIPIPISFTIKQRKAVETIDYGTQG